MRAGVTQRQPLRGTPAAEGVAASEFVVTTFEAYWAIAYLLGLLVVMGFVGIVVGLGFSVVMGLVSFIVGLGFLVIVGFVDIIAGLPDRYGCGGRLPPPFAPACLRSKLVAVGVRTNWAVMTTSVAVSLSMPTIFIVRAFSAAVETVVCVATSADDCVTSWIRFVLRASRSAVWATSDICARRCQLWVGAVTSHRCHEGPGVLLEE